MKAVGGSVESRRRATGIMAKCSILRHFWTELHKVLKNIFSLEFPCEFDTLLLWVLNFDVTRLDKYLWDILLITSKKAVTKKVAVS